MKDGLFLSFYSTMDELLNFVSEYIGHPVSRESTNVITQGASGRQIIRLRLDGVSYIAVSWDNQRADNHSFVPVAQYLKSQGIKVPAILDSVCHANGSGCALVEDLGDINLLSLKGTPWQQRKEYYQQALVELNKLHLIPIPTEFDLQPSFDENLYRWEQEYFAEHFIGTHLHKTSQTWLDHPFLTSINQTLSQLPLTPIHRDFQSQNIHIHQGKTYLIDFQGMRLGLPEYDLASILYDAYAELDQTQINELIEFWISITDKEFNNEHFKLCAMQRLMQALGAFANIGHNRHNEWYLKQIDPALAHLINICRESELEAPLKNLLT